MNRTRPAHHRPKVLAIAAAATLASLLAAGTASAKTLVFCSEGSPENFYPGINTTGTSFDANSQIYGRIVDFERGGTTVVPGLAERWTISPDGLTYTFYIRKGVKWHSNKNFTPSRDFNADDFLFSIERQWKENDPYFKVTSSNHSYFNDMGMPKLLKSVDKVDDYTVKIVLNSPEAPFLSNLAMEYAGIQSKEYAIAMLKAGTPEKLDQEPIGTGPFYLVQYQKDAVIRYKAFPQYWRGKAKIDDLVFAITPDASVRWAKLQKGECHVMPYPNPADLDAIRKDPKITVLEQAGLNVGYLAFNTQKKPFDDVRVRKAISMAINKKAIIDGVYLSTGRGSEESDSAIDVVLQRCDKGRPVRSRSREETARRGRLPQRPQHRLVGDAGAAPLQPERKAHRRTDAGRLGQGRRQGRDQELRVGRVPQAHAGRRAPDGHARLDGRQRRP